MSTRHGGVSAAPYHALNLGYGVPDREEHVAENRRRLAAAVGIAPGQVVAGSISHGRDVSVFRRAAPRTWPMRHLPVRPGASRLQPSFPSDAVVSDVPGMSFLLTFADCVPLLISDQRHGVIGVGHAGWRGTALGIGGEMVRVMHEAFGSQPEDLVAAIGPSIGPCCYEVGAEVFRTFARHGVAFCRGERGTLDLWQSNRAQFVAAGVRHEAIEISAVCTSCHTETYFSHRGEGGRTGRFGLLAGLPA